jgi:pimeloyl-ACP methyl ester carboxylesterase
VLSKEATSPWGQSYESVEEKLENYFSREFKSRNKLLVEAMAKQILEAIKRDSFEEKASRQRTAMQFIDTSSSLSGIRCPCLILHGTDDKIIALEEGGKALHKAIKGSQLRQLEGVGHLILAEYSKELPGEILDFFRNQGWLKN